MQNRVTSRDMWHVQTLLVFKSLHLEFNLRGHVLHTHTNWCPNNSLQLAVTGLLHVWLLTSHQHSSEDQVEQRKEQLCKERLSLAHWKDSTGLQWSHHFGSPLFLLAKSWRPWRLWLAILFALSQVPVLNSPARHESTLLHTLLLTQVTLPILLLLLKM